MTFLMKAVGGPNNARWIATIFGVYVALLLFGVFKTFPLINPEFKLFDMVSVGTVAGFIMLIISHWIWGRATY